MVLKKHLLIASIIVAMSMVACGKKHESTPTEDIAAMQSEIARANNPAPQASEPATPTEKFVTNPVAPADNGGTDKANVGEQLYAQTCKVCHEAGTLGAPKIGDKNAWKERIAQGNDVLYKNAIEGFTGKTGTMIPKGGSNAPDDDVKAAVDYMVLKSS